MTPQLQSAVRMLRNAPPPSDVWRQRLLNRVASGERIADDATAETGRWSVRPLTAIAACVLCAVMGGAAVGIAVRGSTPDDTTLASANRTPASESVQASSLVRFALNAPSAARVSVVGDFNGWDPAALPMRRSSAGDVWEIEIPLAPGRYAYSFVVDGALARDPSAPRATGEDFGSPSSIVLVRGS